MKFRNLFLVLFFSIACAACISKYPKAADEMVASQYFLNSCLQGDFKKADFYMLKDSENIADLASVKKFYEMSNSRNRAAFRAASIILEDNEAVDANTKIITFKNSFNLVDRKLKVVKINGEWKIDLKYTFSGNL